MAQDDHNCSESSRLREIGLDLFRGVLFATIILIVKLPLEHTRIAERIREVTYDLMQRRLYETVGLRPLPVVVVDITNMRMDPQLSGPPAASRKQLHTLLAALARNRPRAIGIDVDFSPYDDGGYSTPDDTEFFNYCNQLRAEQHIPIYLGVGRTAARPPEEWLAATDYQQLAAYIGAPKVHVRSLPRWVRTGAYAPISTLGNSLAQAYREDEQAPPRMLRWALEQNHIWRPGSRDSELQVSDFHVDYGPLERLGRESVKADDIVAGRVSAESVRDRVVILGYATASKTPDLFTIPNRETKFPGVLMHACAVYTLTEAPLFELTTTGRVVLDMSMVLFMVAGVFVIRARYEGTKEQDTAERRGQSALLIVLALTGFFVGTWLVNVTRVVWDDFVFAIFGVLLHTQVENGALRAWRWCKLVRETKRSMPAMEAEE